ncbi:VOC family protein [Oceanomicrobium pacificus]|uniref:VOC family protein n=1 Tax=Oceanomicrobium pacificus TaxID=2692916 RepID=A0A6B0TT69_9RHOB|nr:VOC family protein [Oceanomicrobium pacificus]MXU64422.1 VOC family protein [Oceanomicrobium pacificus]
MQFNPYLTFPGTCRAAMTRYAEIFGGELEMLSTFGEGPIKDHVPKAAHELVMHVRLRVGDALLMASDDPSGQTGAARAVSVQVPFEDPGAARSAFDALAEGGSVEMPFAPTFWARGFGSCRDRFGIQWMINCD